MSRIMRKPDFCIYEGRSKSNKTCVTAPFIKSVDKQSSHSSKL